jgi:hypothetical protein
MKGIYHKDFNLKDLKASFCNFGVPDNVLPISSEGFFEHSFPAMPKMSPEFP